MNQAVQREKDTLNKFFAEIPGAGDVLLLVSPFVWTGTPVLGLHSIQASCRQAGITCHVLYLNLLYSMVTGRDLHSRILLEEYLYLKDRLFASAAFGRSGVTGYMDKFLDPTWMPDYAWKKTAGMANREIPTVFAPFREWINRVDWEHLEALTSNWVQTVAQPVARLGFRVVGCSTTFGGLVPAVALLDSIKKADANVITILGGALCEGEMAEGVLSLKAGIDYVFSGEAEFTFPAFAKEVSAGRLPHQKIIYGQLAEKADAFPIPDYRDYFRQLKRLPADHLKNYEIPYDIGRGCWYGKCTFCSINGEKNVYRRKSTDKVIAELKELTAQNGIYAVFITDPMMPPDYYDTLLPKISKEIPAIRIRHDAKTALTLEQVLTLKKSGVDKVQAGIESLSPSLLKRMQKCVTARENITFLRYARSVHLEINWFLLYGFPGDEIEDYREMLHLIPLIRHLTPPRRMFPMMILRFNQYKRFPEKFGISGLRPTEVYIDTLPLHAHLEKIAYHFYGDFRSRFYDDPGIIVALAEEIQTWAKAWEVYESVLPLEMMVPTLHIIQKTGNEYVLEDTRGLPGSHRRMTLNREQASILLVPRPQSSPGDFQWAVDNQLGVLMESWFIPLATAEPELLLEFERDYGFSNIKGG